jgi:hypothetical protein
MTTDFIYTRAGALPADLCDELVRRFESHPHRGAGATTGGVAVRHKSSLDLTLDMYPDLADLRQKLHNHVIEHLTDYFLLYPFVGSVLPIVKNSDTGQIMELTMDDATRLERSSMRMLIAKMFRCGVINIQKYQAAVDGYPHWHAEICPEPSFEALHRVVLWMYYLNDVEVGGETEFYFQKLKLQPRKGTVVIAPAGFTHTHRGNIPLSGDKYITTSWLLFSRGGQPQG